MVKGILHKPGFPLEKQSAHLYFWVAFSITFGARKV